MNSIFYRQNICRGICRGRRTAIIWWTVFHTVKVRGCYVIGCISPQVAGAGFEPATFWLWARRASRLLYPAIIHKEYRIVFMHRSSPYIFVKLPFITQMRTVGCAKAALFQWHLQPGVTGEPGHHPLIGPDKYLYLLMKDWHLQVSHIIQQSFRCYPYLRMTWNSNCFLHQFVLLPVPAHVI